MSTVDGNIGPMGREAYASRLDVAGRLGSSSVAPFKLKEREVTVLEKAGQALAKAFGLSRGGDYRINDPKLLRDYKVEVGTYYPALAKKLKNSERLHDVLQAAVEYEVELLQSQNVVEARALREAVIKPLTDVFADQHRLDIQKMPKATD